jgi:choline dehydrogenase-like flavoprotein
MFVGDLRDLSSGRTVSADVCIVGGGAAGISLAQELIDSPLEVILLESGGFHAGPDGDHAYEIVPGNPPRLARDPSKAWYLGGNTNHWYGNCRPLDEGDFGVRDWIPHSGWPIDGAELRPYYARAQSASGLGDLSWYDPETCRPHLTHPPLAADEAVLRTRIVQACPVLSFADRYRRQLDAAENVQIVLGSHVVRLKTNSEGSRVSAVETVDANGQRSHVEADQFVLALGGIENARLLLCSDDVTKDGLGNGNDLVGRFFMDHWFFDFGLSAWKGGDVALYARQMGRDAQFEGLESVGDARVWAQLALSDELMQEERLPGLSLWFLRTPTSTTPSVAATKRIARSLLRRAGSCEPTTDARLVLTDPVEVPRYLLRRTRAKLRNSRDGGDLGAGAGYSLRAQIEQVPDPANRIRLATTSDRHGQRHAELAMRITDEQRREHARSLSLAGDALGLDGARLARQLRLMLEGGYESFFWHHMGTTRMSNDPTQGVVDDRCRVHGVSNLYVAGSSVFPTSGTAAPTLTIVALALRLADEIRELAGSTAQARRAPS